MFHTITISHIVPYDYRTNTNRIIFEQLENEYGVTINERRGKYKKLSLSPCIGIWIDFWKINMDAFPVNMDYKYFINIYFNPLEMITSSRIHNTNELDIPLIREKFNDALRYVSNDFMDFNDWQVKRIDYASYFLSEYHYEYIELFKKSKLPLKVKKLEYEGSMYYRNKSRTYNFYSKQFHTEHHKKFSVDEKAQANDYVRIEVQYKYSPIRSIQKKNNMSDRTVKNILSGRIALEEITNAYNKCICKGDFYKLKTAQRRIDKSDYTDATKEKLKDFLVYLRKRKYSNLNEAKADFMKAMNKSVATFDDWIAKLESININPVTLPDDFPVPVLANQLDVIRKNIIDSSYFLDNNTDIDWLENSDMEIIRNYPLIGNDISI